MGTPSGEVVRSRERRRFDPTANQIVNNVVDAGLRLVPRGSLEGAWR
jgi:hypothetical protein